MNLRLVTSLVAFAALVAALGASGAQAGSTCHRSKTVGWSPQFACSPWVWQGPPPFGP